MNSVPGALTVGNLYTLHDSRFGGSRYSLNDSQEQSYSAQSQILECIRLIPNDPYSKYTALVRSTKTGWTMVVHGTNIYEDGSIDWDFSTHGIWTDKDENGVLHQRKY